MATFHLHNDTISRGKGQSVVAAAAYRARERLRDDTTGQMKDYTRKADQPVLFSGLYMPKNAPEWTREQLWNAAEAAEDTYNKTRAKVAITAQDMDLALMDELTPEQNRRLLQDFIREQFTRHGYAVDANIHGPDRDGDQRNIHAHLLITMRTLNAQGFSPVKRQMDRKELSQWVSHWREAWAKTASRHLERAGHHPAAERMAYAHLTLAQQRKVALEKGDHEHAAALAREATQHLGPKATQMERDGKASERGDANRATERRNRAHREHLSELHRELSHVSGEIATEQARSAQAYRMVDAAHTPTVGWWQAARARAALHTYTPANENQPEARPKQPEHVPRTPAARAFERAQEPERTPQPEPPRRRTEQREAFNAAAQPVSPAEAFEKQENESRLDRILRERAERQRREREQERQPGRSIADDWLDGMLNKKDGPAKTRVELRNEQLRQHRGQRRKTPKRDN